LKSALALPDGEADFVLLRDGRSGLEYLRSGRELADRGLYVELHAYETQAFLEMREVTDTDGKWARLSEQLNGRGVPSVLDALHEAELGPLHVALMTDDAPAAVRMAARMVGRPVPEGVAADGAARAVDDFLTTARPDLARGKWIYEWQVDRVLPDADLIALRLDLPAATPRDLVGDERFRRAIGVHEASGTTWFNKEQFANAVTVLGLAGATELNAAAEQSKFRFDALERVLQEPPPWTSTRKPRPVPPGGRSANKRDMSMPPRPTKGSGKAGATKAPAAKSATSNKPTKLR
jgi:hypothetical protein